LITIIPQQQGNHRYFYDSDSMDAMFVFEFMEMFFYGGAMLSLIPALLNFSGNQ